VLMEQMKRLEYARASRPYCTAIVLKCILTLILSQNKKCFP